MAGAYLKGFGDGLGSVGDMILHPVNTLNGMGNALQHLDDTYFAFNNLVNDYVGAIRNGDGQKVAYYTGNFLGAFAGGEMAGGAASRLSQAGKTAFMARTAEGSAVVSGSGTTVLGSFPGYVDLAHELNAARFQIHPAMWDAMTVAEQESANFKFLDISISRGDNFILSNSAFKAEPGTSFFKELQYMYKKGYISSTDGMSLIKK